MATSTKKRRARGEGNLRQRKDGHVTEQMKRSSADRMQQYIDNLKTG